MFVAISAITLGAMVVSNRLDKKFVRAMNGRVYQVMNKGDTQQAADTLASLEIQIKDFVKTAAVAYPGHNLERVRFNGITELPPTNETVAFTMDKRDLFLCIRDADGNVQNFEDLMFILLHEIAHMANPTHGHDERFWKQFKKILEMAHELGYVPYKDYDKYSATVCGTEITSNPLTCVFNGRCKSML